VATPPGYQASQLVATLDRVQGTSKNQGRNINPKHLVSWLVRKPQSFRHYIYRNELLANWKYKQIWEHIDQTIEERAACKLMVRILKLAYLHECEESLADYIIECIAGNKELNITYLESKFIPKQEDPTSIRVDQPTLSSYNILIQQGVSHG
jgi:hypothetical protein